MTAQPSQSPAPAVHHKTSQPLGSPAHLQPSISSLSTANCQQSKPLTPVSCVLEVEKLIPGGQALATLDSGKKIFLWNALPGEIVTSYQPTKEKSSFTEGIALEISSPSPARIAPRDPCYLATSPWQIFAYPDELNYKAELLAEIFRQHHLNLETTTIQPVATDNHDFGYRNKMEYALYYSHDDQKIHPAFRGRGTHHKIPVAQSSLERPEIWQRAVAIIDELNRTGAEARQYQSLLLRSNMAGQVEGGLFENHRPHPVFPRLTDTLLDHTYSYSPNGFFQINLPVYEMVLRAIAHYLATTSAAKVLDLYSGVGTIGLSVAGDRELTLVECDKSAYRELERNCATRGHHVHPIYAKSEDALDFIRSDTTVILDPPRAGCHARLIEQLLSVAPPAIIYLSCNPATQARDLKLLETKYRPILIQPYNFFPRTPHLENLVILEHRS